MIQNSFLVRWRVDNGNHYKTTKAIITIWDRMYSNQNTITKVKRTNFISFWFSKCCLITFVVVFSLLWLHVISYLNYSFCCFVMISVVPLLSILPRMNFVSFHHMTLLKFYTHFFFLCFVMTISKSWKEIFYSILKLIFPN